VTPSRAIKNGEPDLHGRQPRLDRPKFTVDELQEMHDYCLVYRDLVRGGGIPTEEQSEYFMSYQQVCYAEGVAYD